MKHVIYLYYAFLVFLFPFTANADLIYLISTPRSLSTVFLRMMDARGDFIVYNEPAEIPYNFKHYPDQAEEWFQGYRGPKSYNEIKTELLEKSETNNIFVKDMAASLEEFIIHDENFLKNPKVHFVFLTREPHAVMISYYKASNNVLDEHFEKNLGFKNIVNLYEKVKTRSPNPVHLMQASDILRDPEKTIREYCQKMKIPFSKDHLIWKSLGDRFDGTKWHDYVNQDDLYHWHGSAIKSTGFGNATNYDLDSDGNPRFTEIDNQENKAKLLDIYLKNKSLYDRLAP